MRIALMIDDNEDEAKCMLLKRPFFLSRISIEKKVSVDYRAILTNCQDCTGIKIVLYI